MEPWQTIMLVGGVAVVCAAVLPRRQRVNTPQSDQSQTVRNMETALEQFMENMEADNKEMMQLVTKSSQDTQLQAVKRDERIGQLEKRCAELEQLLREQSKQFDAAIAQVKDQAALAAAQAVQLVKAESSAAAEVVSEPQVQVERTPSIRERYADLFELHRNGKSIDAIAKNLGLNKGEVQLILQLSKQEEEARHE